MHISFREAVPTAGFANANALRFPSGDTSRFARLQRALHQRFSHAFVPRREKRCSAVGFPDHATATRQRLKSRGGFLRMCFSQDSGCAGFCRERQHPPDGFPAFEKRTKQGDKTGGVWVFDLTFQTSSSR